MKYLPLFLFLSLAALLYGQPDGTSAAFETFEMESGDSTYVMQKYFIVFLKTGPNRDQDESTAAVIQEQHLAHMSRLAEQQIICMAGPFDDEGSIRGIAIYRTATLEEALQLAGADPAVKAGRLVIEVHPWWAARGSSLF